MSKGALPHLQKGVLPLEESASVMVLMDADLIVLQSLAPLLDEAAKGASSCSLIRFRIASTVAGRSC